MGCADYAGIIGHNVSIIGRFLEEIMSFYQCFAETWPHARDDSVMTTTSNLSTVIKESSGWQQLTGCYFFPDVAT